MKKLCIVLAALLVSLMTDVGAANQVDAIRSRLGLGENGIVVEGERTIYIIGEITPGLAQDFKSMIDQGPSIETVIVDSQGGDMSSALDVANLIYRRKLNVVVDGRCFSACANYLFPAGNLKSVRANSFLGIHNRTYRYLDGAATKQSTRLAEIQSAIEQKSDSKSARILEDLRRKESEFMTAIRSSNTLDVAFTKYVSNRELVLSKDGIALVTGMETCPKINLWVLRRKQVESIGLKNIREFWEPTTAEEKKLLQIYFKVPVAESFIGTATELANLCRAQVRKNTSYQKIQ